MTLQWVPTFHVPMTTLIVTLPEPLPAPSVACAYATTGDGTSVARHGEAALSLLTAPAGAELVVVVPIQQLSWHRLELPRGTLQRTLFTDADAPRLRAVLDGLLEDRVLDDPALLHFALMPHAKEGAPVWVCSCNRAWLHAWVGALEQAGLPVARIVPEMAPPPAHDPNAIGLWLTGAPDAARLVTSGPHGVIQLPLSGTLADPVLPQAALQIMESVTTDPAVAELAEHLFSGRVDLQTPAQRAVRAAQTEWDLAQFDLLRNRRTRVTKYLSTLGHTLAQAPQWRAARWGVLALVVVQLLGLQAWAWKEQAAQAAQRATIRAILTDTFPDVRVVVDAPAQMQRALADLQRQSGAASSADLETILGQFQAAAPGAPAPAAIDFIAGSVLLKGLDPNAPVLADASPRLQAQGYLARWEGNNLAIQPEGRP